MSFIEGVLERRKDQKGFSKFMRNIPREAIEGIKIHAMSLMLIINGIDLSNITEPELRLVQEKLRKEQSYLLNEIEIALLLAMQDGFYLEKGTL